MRVEEKNFLSFSLQCCAFSSVCGYNILAIIVMYSLS
jgi:hypothetical protein